MCHMLLTMPWQFLVLSCAMTLVFYVLNVALIRASHVYGQQPLVADSHELLWK